MHRMNEKPSGHGKQLKTCAQALGIQNNNNKHRNGGKSKQKKQKQKTLIEMNKDNNSTSKMIEQMKNLMQ